MKIAGGRRAACAALLLLLVTRGGVAAAADPGTNQSRIEAALSNIVSLERPGQDGLALVWDGNKYVQCRRMADHSLRCEAGGVLCNLRSPMC
jgi:hypothetical protein